MAGPSEASDSPVSRHRAQADRIRQARTPWDRLYQDAYDYVIPHRRPQALGDAKGLADRIFDMTGPSSGVHFGGTLQRNILPPGEPPFVLETGPLLLQQIGEKGKIEFDRRAERVAKFIHPFMHAGDFDTATLETCTDLGVGTGAIMPLKGDFERPLIYLAIPVDEISTKTDAWGRDSYITWQRKLPLEAIVEGFPEGNFATEFRETARAHPYSEVTLYQDFWRDPRGGGWRFCAYVADKNDGQLIAESRFRTQPIAIVRYHRLSGEAYGRGPILMALPAIKVLNKAQELTLKSAAIQMLGIWGYRAGGTFNPDTVRVGPGEFWPMQSTGGILGPDVQRIDPASARLDVARLVVDNLQAQVRAALLDERLPDQTGTPKSASEIAARLRQGAQSHIGVFGRLWRELMPVLVPRSAEILNEFGYLDSLMNFNELLVSIKVRSPMAAALKADQMMRLANYVESIAAMVGPAGLRRYADMDSIADAFADGLMIDKRHVPTPEQRAAIDEQIAAEEAGAVAAEMATRAAPQLAGGLLAIDGGKAAA